MKNHVKDLLALLVAVGVSCAAIARQIVVPTQPMSPFADTEVSTNVVIQMGVRFYDRLTL